MRTRHIELMTIMLNNQSMDLATVLSIYDISKRTLFYDLEAINYALNSLGKIRVDNNRLLLDGELETIENHLKNQIFQPYYDQKERKDRILLSILEDKHQTIDDYAESFAVSKTTIFSDIENLKGALLQEDVQLVYHKRYLLKGDEAKIRDIYLRLLACKPFDSKEIRESVIRFNKQHHLLLSDYAMFYLSHFLDFIERRIAQNHFIHWDVEVTAPFDFDSISRPQEINYLKAYILSLATSHQEESSILVHHYVQELLQGIKAKMALDIDWDERFYANLENHLIASFYRIKFGFPALNPSLMDIRVKYYYLFVNVKHVILSLKDSIFHRMRDEEIGFVVAYLGGYLYDQSPKSQRVILVCPHGRAVSQHLQHQIEHRLPHLRIAGIYAVNELSTLTESYDAIITTLDLPYFKNVIKVNPILTPQDENRLAKIFSKEKPQIIDEVLSLVSRFATIHDQQQLKKELEKVLTKTETIRRHQPMLQELITRERIQTTQQTLTWEEAIQLASAPLLKEGVFTERYVEAMIQAVKTYGPYIVLADEFALPHASSQNDVKEVALALLISNQPVDLMGKPVKLFMVLATVDNHTHLKALASLTDILSLEENLEILKNGNVDEILNLMKGGAK